MLFVKHTLVYLFIKVVLNMNSSVCVICDEKGNKTTHAPIKCEYCDYTACKQCCETYIMGIGVPKCMEGKCGKEWTRKFMANNFTGVFLTGRWKKRVEQRLLDKEIALLPETQPFVEEIVRVEKIKNEIKYIELEIKRLYNNKRDLILSKISKPNKVAPPKQYVRACPDPECRGFLSNQWKCGLCQKWTCPDCHAIKGLERCTEHVCNPDEVASAQLLAKDTKHCPNCSTGIFKIDGCDQMWCTQCHVAFSWKSGLIETKIHNPHFYEWQRLHGTLQREPGDVVCGREINHHMILDPLILSLRDTNRQAYINLQQLIININHLKNVQLRNYLYDAATEQLEDRYLRMQYLRKFIDLKTFGSRIQQVNKKKEKKREIFQLLTMFVDTVTEIFFRVVHNLLADTAKNIVQDAKNIVQEFASITKYANDCLLEIAHTYKATPLFITPITEASKCKNNDILINTKKCLLTGRKHCKLGRIEEDSGN